MKTYVTFGSDHNHVVNGKNFNANTVAVIECDSPQHGRERAFELFGPQFCVETPEAYYDGLMVSKYGAVEVSVD